jgi:hypothetical protein
MKRKTKLFLGDIIENMKMAEELTSDIEFKLLKNPAASCEESSIPMEENILIVAR